MKTKLVVGSILLLAVILINSCEDKQVAPVAAACTTDTMKVTYSSGSNTMVQIINTQCGVNNSACHAPKGASGYDYSTYAGISANAKNGLLYAALFGGNVPQMPLTPQAGWSDSSACMREKFKAWISQGYPE